MCRAFGNIRWGTASPGQPLAGIASPARRRAEMLVVGTVPMHNTRNADSDPVPYLLALGEENTWEISFGGRVDEGVARLVMDFCRAMGPGLKAARPNRRLVVEGDYPDGISLVSAARLPCHSLPEETEEIRAQGLIRSFPGWSGVPARVPAAGTAKALHMRHLLMPIWDGCIESGGVPIHGALLDRLGNGVVLIGRSGAGKTTCCRRLPKGWTVLGDDLAVLMPGVRNDYRAQPLPTWSAVASGTVQWPCRANTSVSLRALFLLDQSDNDEALPMGALQAAAAIHAAAQQALIAHGPRSHWRRGKRLERVLDTAIRIARSVPAYRLRVSLHGRFWEKIEEVLENGDNPLFRCETGEQKTA